MGYQLLQKGNIVCELGEDQLQHKAGVRPPERRGAPPRAPEPDRVYLQCPAVLAPGEYELRDEIGATATISVQAVRADPSGGCLAQAVLLSVRSA